MRTDHIRPGRAVAFLALAAAGLALGCNTPTITDGGPGGGGGGSHVATRLHITGQPGAALAGHVIAPPVRVVVADNSLLAITSSTAPISVVAIGTVPDSLRGPTTLNAVSGTAIFGGLVLDSLGSFQLIASSPGLASDTSDVFVIGTTVSDTTVIDLGNTASDTLSQVAFTSERNLSTNPAVDTVPLGGVINWHWRGSLVHGAIFTSGTLVYNTGNFSAPTDVFLTMSSTGTFGYECSVHGTAMTGQIVVQ